MEEDILDYKVHISTTNLKSARLTCASVFICSTERDSVEDKNSFFQYFYANSAISFTVL